MLFSRGDLQSVRKVFDCFQEFSRVSGLIANQNKSNVYFGGVTESQQDEILRYPGFKKGLLPFRYPGVPLSTKKLTISQCQPLIDRMMQNIQTWSVKFLSYAGRLQLIQSVLLSNQNFWSQIFLVPKKILQQVETICKSFPWNGEVQNRGKA